MTASNTMTDAELSLALIHVGMMFAGVRRYTVSEWLEIADKPGLSPVYRQHVHLLAELREQFDATIADLTKGAAP